MGGSGQELNTDTFRVEPIAKESKRLTFVLSSIAVALAIVLILMFGLHVGDLSNKINSSEFKVGDIVVHKLGVKALIMRIYVRHDDLLYEVKCVGNSGILEIQCWERKELISSREK